MSNIYYWKKLTFSKLVRKVNFLEKNLKCTSFEEQIVQGIFGKTLILVLLKEMKELKDEAHW